MSSDDDVDSDTEVLNVHVAQPVDARGEDKWTVKCKLQNKNIKFRIDTGARCNTLTLKDYQMIQYKGKLQKSTKLLRTYSNHQIKQAATADLTVKFNDKKITAPFHIVDLDQENVLSGSTAEALLLISRLSAVDTADLTKDNQVPEGLREFPELIHTTRTLPGTYTIKLEPNVKGVVHAAHRLPVALKQKAIDQLQEMETDGYITSVEELGQLHGSLHSGRQNSHLSELTPGT